VLSEYYWSVGYRARECVDLFPGSRDNFSRDFVAREQHLLSGHIIYAFNITIRYVLGCASLDYMTPIRIQVASFRDIVAVYIVL